MGRLARLIVRAFSASRPGGQGKASYEPVKGPCGAAEAPGGVRVVLATTPATGPLERSAGTPLQKSGFGRCLQAKTGGDTMEPFMQEICAMRRIVLIGLTAAFLWTGVDLARSSPAAEVPKRAQYDDGRPAAKLRLDAVDHGVVLRHGDGPGQCDILGARDVWVYEADGTYYMHYDAAGPKGWLAALATSKDLIHWQKKGPVLELGKAGENDSASASYGTTFYDGRTWHMFYLGTPHATPAPDLVPAFPYLTMKARSDGPAGPWTKQKEVIPFQAKPGTYYSVTASPGQIVKQGDEYRMFFSAATDHPIRRTLSIARTKNLDGPWTLDPEPILPATEQVENSSLYFEQANKTWFLFTNHVGHRRLRVHRRGVGLLEQGLGPLGPGPQGRGLGPQQLLLVQAHRRIALRGPLWRPAGLVLRRQRGGEDARWRQEPHGPGHRAGMAATCRSCRPYRTGEGHGIEL